MRKRAKRKAALQMKVTHTRPTRTNEPSQGKGEAQLGQLFSGSPHQSTALSSRPPLIPLMPASVTHLSRAVYTARTSTLASSSLTAARHYSTARLASNSSSPTRSSLAQRSSTTSSSLFASSSHLNFAHLPNSRSFSSTMAPSECHAFMPARRSAHEHVDAASAPRATFFSHSL